MTISAREQFRGWTAARGGALALALLGVAGVVHGEEKRGCDAFAWSLEREAAALREPQVAAATGRVVSDAAFTLTLAPIEAAALPMPPERAQKPGTRAGALVFSPPAAGLVQVTLSANAWIDVVQDGRYVKPAAFTGAVGCPGLRKSVRYPLEARPFTLQLSGATEDAVGVVVSAVAAP